MPESRTPTVFVGRIQERQQLHKTLRTVNHSKQPKVIFIQGEYGLGKTLLVEQFAKEALARDPSLLLGKGQCSMETEMNGMVPFIQLLDGLVGHSELASSLLELAKDLTPALLNLLPGWGQLAGTTLSMGTKLLSRQPNTTQESLFANYTRTLNGLLEQRAVLFIIEDLHWADSTSLELMFHLMRNVQQCSLLILCTYRPVEGLETGRNAELFRRVRANLFRFGADEIVLKVGIDVADYVAGRYPVHHFEPDFLDNVQFVTGGHPLLVHELFSLWEDKHFLVSIPTPDGKFAWSLVPGAAIGILDAQPHNLPRLLEERAGHVAEVLEERVQTMTDELRKVLACASVEGQDFTAQIVAIISKQDEMSTFDNLEALDHRYRLVEEAGAVETFTKMLDVYRFAHRFYRDHIYGQLAPGQRRLLHLQVGEGLELLYDDKRPVAGMLSQHFYNARVPKKAATYGLLASQYEASHFAWGEVQSWCDFSLSCLADLPEHDILMEWVRLDLLEESGDAYTGAGKCLEAIARYHSALDLAMSLGAASERKAELCYRLAWGCESAGQDLTGLHAVQEGLKILTTASVPFGDLQFRLQSFHALLQERLGDNKLAESSLKELLERVRDCPELPVSELSVAHALDYLGVILYVQGRYSEGAAALKESVEIAQRFGDELFLSIPLHNLADLYTTAGDYAAANTVLTQAMELSKRIGDQDGESYEQYIEGYQALARGHYNIAIEKLTQAATLSDELGILYSVVRADLALALLADGQVDQAKQQASQALAQTENGRIINHSYAHYAMGRVEAALGHWASAETNFLDSLRLCEPCGYQPYGALNQRHLAEVLLSQGRVVEAERMLAAAIDAFRAIGHTQDLAEAEKVLLAMHKRTA